MAAAPKEITTDELASSLADVLARVHQRGERFIVVQGQEAVAAIGPANLPGEEAARNVTLGEFLEALRRLPAPDSGFADDVEAIQANQPPATEVRWDS
jgi:antitoxin (DNA-binding transcriptional repressor) of toxin-antitoxin stability system